MHEKIICYLLLKVLEAQKDSEPQTGIGNLQVLLVARATPLPGLGLNVLRLCDISARSSIKELKVTELFILYLKSPTIFHITRTPLKR